MEKIPWRRKRQSTPVLLPGKFHGLRSLVGYSTRGSKELDTTEQLNRTEPKTRLLGDVVKNLLANAGDVGGMGSIPGLGRSPRGGNGDPPQCSCLENSMDRGA